MGKFVIRKVSSGGKFDLRSGNGQGIATSEVYASEEACRKGIEGVRKNAVVARVEDQTVEGYKTVPHPKFQIYEDKSGQFRFRLKARNAQVIAISEGYTTKAACMGGIQSVRENAGESAVTEE